MLREYSEDFLDIRKGGSEKIAGPGGGGGGYRKFVYFKTNRTGGS